MSREKEKKEKGERDVVGQQQHLAELQALEQGDLRLATTDNSRRLLHCEWSHSKDILGSIKPAGGPSVVLS